MLTAAVSLVIPIYNVEDYLQECLDSVASQTVFTQLEVLLIDDGSTDSSGEIADSFAAGHHNVHVFHKTNGGLGDARNFGITRATAPHITFLDSDDILPPNAIESLLAGTQAADSPDLIIGNMETFPKDQTWVWSKYFREILKPTSIDLEDLPDLIHGASACNKLFPTKALREAQPVFGVGISFEDAHFTVPYMLKARNVVLVPETVYLYRQRINGTSIMDSRFTRPQNLWDMLALSERLIALRDTLPILQRNLINLFVIRAFRGDILIAEQVLPPEEVESFLERAQRVVRAIPSQAIEELPSAPKYTIAALALRSGDRELLTRAQTREHRIAVIDNQPTIVTVIPDERRAHHTVLHKTNAWLEVINRDPKDETLELLGHFNFPGVIFTPQSSGLTARLRVYDLKGNRLESIKLQLMQREDRPATPQERSTFRALLPLTGLPSGKYQLRIWFSDGTQGFTRHLQLMPGVYKRPVRLSVGDRQVELVKRRPVDRKRVFLSIAPKKGLGRTTSLLRRTLDPLAPLRWRARLFIRATTRSRGRLILIGERRDTAQDNGFALFLAMRSDPEYRDHVFYILDRESSSWDRASSLGHVLPHSSLLHKLYTLRATHLVSSQDIDSYLLPKFWDRAQFRHYLSFNIPWKRVFLQHGVAYTGIGPALRRGQTGLDLLVTTTKQEAKYFIRHSLGYSSREIRRLGLPRYDQLTTQSKENLILVAPTWRKNLATPSYSNTRTDEELGTLRFKASDFKAHFDAILNSPTLHSTLRQHGYKLVFLPHYEFRQYYSDYSSPSPDIVIQADGGRSIGTLLANCKIFVTDYSSTHFDAAYSGSAVIYSMFDEDTFFGQQYEHGWFDPRTNGFGPVVTDAAATTQAILDYLMVDGKRESVYDSRAEETFGRRDGRNSQRVAEAIWNL